MASSGICKGCGQPMLWYPTTKGRMMPIDPVSVEDGNFVIEDGIVRVLQKGELFPPKERYKSHYATCPKAAEFRRKK